MIGPLYQPITPETLMSFLSPSQTDVRRRRLLVGGASLLLTTIVMTGFLLESRWGYSGKDVKLIFVQSWRADRTRDDAMADNKATEAAQQARLAESRAYIATLTGEPRAKAQKEYDRYVEGGGAQKEMPYIPARPAGGAIVTPPTIAAAAPALAAEPPVL
ncbi:MAG: hypothetical protein H7268_01665 [Sandarakinorhabdus sp.]|nr:hypothetical protein [Sandarakinorhabdus sp.]